MLQSTWPHHASLQTVKTPTTTYCSHNHLMFRADPLGHPIVEEILGTTYSFLPSSPSHLPLTTNILFLKHTKLLSQHTASGNALAPLTYLQHAGLACKSLLSASDDTSANAHQETHSHLTRSFSKPVLLSNQRSLHQTALRFNFIKRFHLIRTFSKPVLLSIHLSLHQTVRRFTLSPDLPHTDFLASKPVLLLIQRSLHQTAVRFTFSNQSTLQLTSSPTSKAPASCLARTSPTHTSGQ